MTKAQPVRPQILFHSPNHSFTPQALEWGTRGQFHETRRIVPNGPSSQKKEKSLGTVPAPELARSRRTKGRADPHPPAGPEAGRAGPTCALTRTREPGEARRSRSGPSPGGAGPRARPGGGAAAKHVAGRGRQRGGRG